MDASNTGDNRPTNKGQFKKGDPRINRKGRPKDFDALRALAQQIAHEEAQNAGKPLVIGGHVVTVTEAILRSWAQSKDPRLQQAFMQIAFGKVPDTVQLTGKDGGPIQHTPVTLADWRKQRDERRQQAADAAAMTDDE
jgi:hypothetical protein